MKECSKEKGLQKLVLVHDTKVVRKTANNDIRTTYHKHTHIYIYRYFQ